MQPRLQFICFPTHLNAGFQAIIFYGTKDVRNVGSNAVTLVTGQILQLTLDHPANSEGIATIRSDYPDSLIAGLTTEFTAPYFRLFLEVDGTIYQSDTLTLAAQTDSQQVTVDSLSEFTVISSLPSQSDAAFGFWNYGARSLTAATGSGSLTTGVSIRFAIAYAYPSPNLVLTKIAHEGLEEIPYTLIEAIARAGAYGKVALEGSEQISRGTLNFNDPLFSSSDNAIDDSTEISLPAVRAVYFSTSAPTGNDDGSSGYRRGDRWHHYTNNFLNGSFVLMDATNGSAVWASEGSGSGGAGSGITTKTDLAALKALVAVGSDTTYLLKSNNSVYRYDSGSTADGNDNTVVIPDDKADPPLPGRFLKIGKYTADEIEQTTRKFATQEQLDAIASNSTGITSNTNEIASKSTAITSNTNAIASNSTAITSNTNTINQKAEAGHTHEDLSGEDGQNPIAQTTFSFVIPQSGANVLIQTSSFNSWMFPGMLVVIQANESVNGASRFHAKVDTVASSEITVQNVSQNPNIVVGSTVASGATIVQSGEFGQTGTLSGSTSGLILEHGSGTSQISAQSKTIRVLRQDGETRVIADARVSGLSDGALIYWNQVLQEFSILSLGTSGQILEVGPSGLQYVQKPPSGLRAAASTAATLNPQVGFQYILQGIESISLPPTPENGSLLGFNFVSFAQNVNKVPIIPGQGHLIDGRNSYFINRVGAVVLFAFADGRWDIVAAHKLTPQVNQELILTETLVLTRESPLNLYLNPNGQDRNVVLPNDLTIYEQWKRSIVNNSNGGFSINIQEQGSIQIGLNFTSGVKSITVKWSGTQFFIQEEGYF